MLVTATDGKGNEKEVDVDFVVVCPEHLTVFGPYDDPEKAWTVAVDLSDIVDDDGKLKKKEDVGCMFTVVPLVPQTVFGDDTDEITGATFGYL